MNGNAPKNDNSVLKERLSLALKGAKGIITPSLVAINLKINQQEASRILSRWCKAGWLERVRQGIYIPLAIDVMPDELAIEDPLVIIDQLYKPGYFAGFSAIKHWDLSEQIFETITFFTEKKIKKRQEKIGAINVQLKTISKKKNFGTKVFWQNSKKLKVSDPTKTIADLLDDPKVGGGMRVVFDFFKNYLKSEYYDINLLVDYLDRNENKTAFKRLGFLLELLESYPQEVILKINEKISSGYSEFDSTMYNDRVIRKWNLKVPLSWKKEYDRNN